MPTNQNTVWILTTYTSQGIFNSNVLTHYTAVIISGIREMLQKTRSMTGNSLAGVSCQTVSMHSRIELIRICSLWSQVQTLLMDIVLYRNRLMSANLMSLLYHLSKPHTSETALHMCLCMLTCLLVCLDHLLHVNFKWVYAAFTNAEHP